MMLTKENLLTLKYKELVVLAKEFGVYKSRSKKVYLLDKLLSLIDSQPLESTSTTNANNVVPSEVRRETFDINPPNNVIPPEVRRETFDINPPNNVVPSEVRRETFDINPHETCVNEISEEPTFIDGTNNVVPSEVRRETFDINPQENVIPVDNGRKSILRQNTFSIDKPKDNLTPKETGRRSILRQNTFSVDRSKSSEKTKTSINLRSSVGINEKENLQLGEMPGIISQNYKDSPKIKPFIVHSTASSLVKFQSPIVTRSSTLPSSIPPSKSIGQRIQNQRSVKNEGRPSSRGSKLQKRESTDVGSLTPLRVHKTSIKGGRIEKKITPSKLPNFKAIHMREFSKMESIIEHSQRKAERTKTLMTPIKANCVPVSRQNGKSLINSRIPLKMDLKPKIAETKCIPVTLKKSDSLVSNKRKSNAFQSNRETNVGSRKSHLSNIKEKIKFIDSPMTKVRRKSLGGTVNDEKKLASTSKKRFENVKEIVTTKIHPFSVERNRVKGRDFLQSVRMNRRFQLQMDVMRKAKV